MYDEEDFVQPEEVQQPRKTANERLSSAYDKYQKYNDLKEKYNGFRKNGNNPNNSNKPNKPNANNTNNKKNNNKSNDQKYKAQNKKEPKKNDDKKKDSKADSAKKKKDATNQKFNNNKNNQNNKLAQAKDMAKNPQGEAREKILRALVQKIPYAGAVVEKRLQFGKGKELVDKFKNTPDIVEAAKNLIKDTIALIVSDTVKISLVSILSSVLPIFIIVIVVFMIGGKFSDSQTWAKGSELGNAGSSAVEEKYREFYENVEKHGTANQAMVVAVLTSYKDNDLYTNPSDYEDKECTEEEINNGDCVELGINQFSKSKMKKYIKEVNKAILDSGRDVTEGSYDDPYNTGSQFFRWLYSSFVVNYYSEYFGESTEEISKQRTEIVKFIYSYYKDISQSEALMKNYCTATGEEIRLSAFDDTELAAQDKMDMSKVTTDEHGWKFYEHEGKKYLAVAAATNHCLKNSCTSEGKFTKYDYITYYNLFDIFTLTFDGKSYESIVIDYCGACHWSQETRGDATPNRIDIWTENDEMQAGIPDYGNLNSSGCTISGDQILLGDQGIYSASIFPVGSTLENVKLTQGYRYDSYSDKEEYHGAIDLYCQRDNAPSSNFNDIRSFCTSIPIIASHSGVVTSVVRNQNCAHSKYENADTTLPISSSCDGNSVIIQIKDENDPFNGYKFHYWHFETIEPNIQVGTEVAMGQLLGHMGSTGRSNGWHLHFAILNSQGQKLNQNNNILKFVETHGLYSDGISTWNEGPEF